MLWFYFIPGSNLISFFQTHCHQITIPKTKEIKFEPRIKSNHNMHATRSDEFCVVVCLLQIAVMSILPWVPIKETLENMKDMP